MEIVLFAYSWILMLNIRNDRKIPEIVRYVPTKFLIYQLLTILEYLN